MKLSRTASYAVHVMVFIAQHDDDGPPIVGRIAARELGIPEGFLLRILVALSRAGLLRSLNGPNGGYNLGGPAKQITLLEIIEAVDGQMQSESEPVSQPPVALDAKLKAATLKATETVRKEFGRVTLAELAGGRKKRR
jgi:Rrf2 family cysteine metabolism transcriptional repressor